MSRRPPGPPARSSKWGLRLAALFAVGAVAGVGYAVGYPMWDADRSLARAKASLSGFDFPAAERNLARVFAHRPDHPEAAYLQAQLLRRTERYPEARKQLAEAERLGWIAELIELEKLLLQVQEFGPVGPAEAKAKLWIDASHPEDRLLFEGLTQAYLDGHLLPQAAALLDRWTDRYPDDWYPRFRRGEVRDVLVRRDEAMADYRFVLERHPDHPAVRRKMAEMYLGVRQELEQAAELLEEQVRRFPADADALADLAEVRQSGGRPDEAARLTDAALAAKPTHPRALALKAGLVRAADPAAAFDLYRRADALVPDDLGVVQALGQLAAQLGRPDEAARYADRHRMLDAEKKRLNDLATAVRERPHDPDVRCQIGQAMIAVGRPKESVGWFFSALRADPNHRPTHESLSVYYLGPGGDPVLAARHRRAADQLKAAGK